jgi:hypothetical protein
MSCTPICGAGNPYPLSIMKEKIDERLRIISLMRDYRFSP